MRLELTEVPPPDRASIDPRAESLGLVRGLRVEVADHQYRCHSCKEMQPRDGLLVWVPSGTDRRDPEWSVEERCRESEFNGERAAWCIRCAPKKERLVKGNAGVRPWWKFW